jgi:iron complex transport system permease protein
MVLPVGCLLGALISLGALLLITRFTDDLLVVLLTGFLLSSLFLSVGSFLTTLAQGYWELGRAVVAFTMGGVGGSGPRQVFLVAPLTLAGAIAAWCWARPLDLLLTGEEEARSLGVNVGQVRHWSVIWVALLTAAAVSVGGNVGFVGLIVPHILRPFTGAAHRRLVPAAAILGGAFLVFCDLLTRVLPEHGEIPLGVITGLIGAPLFLFLLIRNRWAEGYG